MRAFTQRLAAFAAATLVLIRRGALTAFEHDDGGVFERPYVGLHTPDIGANAASLARRAQ
jgi:hypothetical protein